jgi:molybdate/tungstate transport system substrate-binding protein
MTSAKLLRLAVSLSLLFTGCGGTASQPPGGLSDSTLIHGSGVVSVIYAASLTSAFERRLGPGFEGATGFSFQGEGKGSIAIANLIRDKVRRPDVFVSADPVANQALQGAANGDYVSWWIPFVRTELVVGWSPKSSFASDFEAARNGKRTWESVLEQPGLKLGRTDPELDPKGYRTLFLLQLDEQRIGQAGLSQKILGASGNPAQIFPEEQLVARLQSGQLDAGFFYTVEAVEAELPYLHLPAEVNQGDPGQAARYATATYTNKKGQTFKGSPVLYTVTIPSTVRNARGAAAFIQYLLSRSGQSQLTQAGLPSVPAQVEGDPGALPAALKPLIKS